MPVAVALGSPWDSVREEAFVEFATQFVTRHGHSVFYDALNPADVATGHAEVGQLTLSLARTLRHPPPAPPPRSAPPPNPNQAGLVEDGSWASLSLPRLEALQFLRR